MRKTGGVIVGTFADLPVEMQALCPVKDEDIKFLVIGIVGQEEEVHKITKALYRATFDSGYTQDYVTASTGTEFFVGAVFSGPS